MTLAVTALTGGADSTDATVYTTASITPSANKLILAAITTRHSTACEVPTVAGNGLTWVKVADQPDAAGRMTSVWRAMGASPTTGTVTFTHATNHQGAVWSVCEISGVDLTGTNGSGAIGQILEQATTADPHNAPVAVSLINSGVYAVFGRNANEIATADADYTLIHAHSHGAPVMAQMTEFRATHLGDLIASADWGSSLAGQSITVEIIPADRGQVAPVAEAIS